MIKHLTEIVASLSVIGILFGAYIFVDAKHAQAADLIEFKAKVVQTFYEDELDDEYYRLETAELNLEDDPGDAQKRRRIIMIMRNIDRLVARIDRDAGIQ